MTSARHFAAPLPAEIIQEIVSWNSAENDDLRTYCLVSKAWRAASLPFLFSEIAAKSVQQLKRWSDFLKSSPDMAKFVRSFKIYILDLNLLADSEDLSAEDPLPVFSSLPPLPCVQKLDWGSLGVPTEVTPSVVQFLQSIPYLRRVKLRSEFLDVKHLKSFLGYCGPIRDLEMSASLEFANDVTTESEVDSIKPNPSPPLDLSKLECLKIDAESSLFNWFLDIMLDVSKPVDLRDVEIQSIGLSLPALCRLFNEFSLTLRNLKLDPADMSSHTFSPRPLPSSFPPLSVLRTLTLGMIQLDYTGESVAFQPKKALRWVCDFLNVIYADKLQTLELTFYAEEPDDVEHIVKHFRWKRVTSTLLKRCRSVEELVLNFGMEREFGGGIRERLESLVKSFIPSSIFGGKRVCVRWTNLNPDWASYSDTEESDDGEDDEDESDGELVLNILLRI